MRYQSQSSGAIPTPTLHYICPVDIAEARAFVKQHHYSEVMPRITRISVGGYTENHDLLAIATLGFGTRPKHTIKKMFPSLDTNDYLEFGKLCLSDELPKNSESWFISRLVRFLKEEYPTLKLLFSWADGIIGKPGYVYQASNFYYGGFIWTEMYLDKNGNRCHVRSIQGHPDLPSSGGQFKSRAYELTVALGYQKYFGLQFRYVYPLCSRDTWECLRLESPFTWERGNYPKDSACVWKKQTGRGSREFCSLPAGIKTRYSINVGRERHEELRMIPTAAESAAATKKGKDSLDRDQERRRERQQAEKKTQADWEDRVIMSELRQGILKEIQNAASLGKSIAAYSYPQGAFKRLCEILVGELKLKGYRASTEFRRWEEEVDSPGGASCTIHVEW